LNVAPQTKSQPESKTEIRQDLQTLIKLPKKQSPQNSPEEVKIEKIPVEKPVPASNSNNSVRKTSEDDCLKVFKTEDLMKQPQQILLSEDYPNNAVKGIWVIPHFEDKINDAPITSKTYFLTSPEFELPTKRKFKLTLYLKNRSVEKHKCYGAFFNLISPINENEEEKYKLSLYIKAKRRTLSKKKYACYENYTKTFTQNDTVWGSAKLIKKSLVSSEDLEDMLYLQFKIQPQNPHKEIKEKTEEKSEYVGLVNHGTTCYVNSMLQSLFTINEFKRAIFAIPTADSEIGTIPYAFQRVFYHLQTSKEAVSISELLYSFGWKKSDFTEQHDIQEFKCFLADVFEKIEQKLKDTPYEGIFVKLFQGKIITHIQCTEIDVKSNKTETFNDIQLNVKGCKNIIDSFDKYIEKEELTGDNKYLTEANGLQNAEKSIQFAYLPPVLQLHLKRFEYTSTRMLKINDELKFPVELDLTSLVHDSSQSLDYSYRLHSVVVHRGQPSSGHYYAFIWNNKLSHWLKFNDTKVSIVDEKEAIESNFGGKYKTHIVNTLGTAVLQKVKENNASAYMLIYIKSDKYDEIQKPFDNSEIPKELVARFEKESTLLEKFKKNIDSIKGTTQVYVVSPEMIEGWTGPSIGPGLNSTYLEEHIKMNTKYRAKLPVSSELSLNEFVAMFAQDAGILESELEVFKIGFEGYALSLALFYDNEWKKPIKDIAKLNGVFFMNTSKTKQYPLFVKRTEEEIVKEKQDLESVISLLAATKQQSSIIDMNHEIGLWKTYTPPKSGDRVEAIENKKENESNENENKKLIFLKIFDPAEIKTKLLKTLMVDKNNTLAEVLENNKLILNSEFTENVSEFTIFEETIASLEHYVKLWKKDSKITDLDEGTILICVPGEFEENEEELKETIDKITNYIKERNKQTT